MVVDHNRRLARVVGEAVADTHFPVVLGGDHAIAVGTWSAVTAALDGECRFGLIWIDAHMDAHTPDTADQGKWGGYYHGRPLACLLGHGEADLTKLASPNTKLAPEHVCLIGVRSFEAGEEKLLADLGVKVFHMSTVREQRFARVFEAAREHVLIARAGYGMTIDLDGFDPADAPGIGSPEEDGLLAEEVLPSLAGLAHDPRMKALEIAEYNPRHDIGARTADLVTQLLVSSFTKPNDRDSGHE